jgi:hypothetical protein
VAIILGREFAVTVLRSVGHARGVTIPASPLGKFKMTTQVIAILLLILGRDHLQGFFVLGQAALWVALVAAIASGIDYYRRFQQVLSPWSRMPADPAESLPVQSDKVSGIHRVARPVQADHRAFGAHRDRRAAGD